MVCYEWCDYDWIVDDFKCVVLIFEDVCFMEYIGFDWCGICYVIECNEEVGCLVVGGFMVIQQLVKNLFLSSEKFYVCKIQEVLIVLMLEIMFFKKCILELYLNIVQWGNWLFGVQVVVWYYFGVDVYVLSLVQVV